MNELTIAAAVVLALSIVAFFVGQHFIRRHRHTGDADE